MSKFTHFMLFMSDFSCLPHQKSMSLFTLVGCFLNCWRVFHFMTFEIFFYLFYLINFWIPCHWAKDKHRLSGYFYTWVFSFLSGKSLKYGRCFYLYPKILNIFLKITLYECPSCSTGNNTSWLEFSFPWKIALVSSFLFPHQALGFVFNFFYLAHWT